MKGCLLVILALLATPANANSFCKTVRQIAQGRTLAELEQMAVAYGLSERDKARARACLRRR